ncbi:MAG: hypothetical protein KAJ66_01330 [Candidatus Omnitrophica bacterium]|nr:hypothetical protein [Candidatus Omnitrophota bacterium]
MKKPYKLSYLLSTVVILGLTLIFTPSVTLATEDQLPEEPLPYPLEELFSVEASQVIPLNITIKDITRSLEAGERYTITWQIEGLTEEQPVEHTCLYWAYLSNLESREELEDYKNYPYQGQLFTYNQAEYIDEVFLNPHEVVPPAIMLVIHLSINGKDYNLGPIPIDIVSSQEN